MKSLFITAFLMLGLASMNAQISATSTKKELVPTKRINKEVVTKKEETKRIYSSIKRTVKIIREEKEVVKG